MSPKILEYKDGLLTITPEAYCIPEIKVFIDTEDDPRPYLAYVHLMTAIDSPFINIPHDERSESIIYDINQTIGEFDLSNKYLQQALDKFEELYTSRTKRYYDSLGKLMDKVSKYADEITITDDNVDGASKRIKEAGATMRSYKDAEKQVDEELKTKMRGKSNLGDY